MSAWRDGKKAWGGKSRPPDLKVPTSEHTADVVILCEPKDQNFGYKSDTNVPDIRYFVHVGYLAGNSQAGMYNRDKKEKYVVEAEVGDVHTLWLAISLTQALVNEWPDEDEVLTGKVIKVKRALVTGGRFGSYLGYNIDVVEDASQALIDSIVAKYEAGEDEEEEETPGETETISAGGEDLEVAFNLVSTSLGALETMTFIQIDNFLTKRRQSGLMKTKLTAAEVANYCVSKDPTVFEIVTDGDIKSLVLK